jgi:hypothetical protein
MPGHDVIVIGGSAGSLAPLITLVTILPPDLPAAVCVARHTSPHARNMVPLILSKAGPLPATEAVDGEPLQPGHIYVAPPGYHLVLTPEGLRVSRSATENRFRPAIDPLFRSAAVAYGPRVVGVLLSGGQDDGTAGLWAIKQQGGIAVHGAYGRASAPGRPHGFHRGPLPSARPGGQPAGRAAPADGDAAACHPAHGDSGGAPGHRQRALLAAGYRWQQGAIHRDEAVEFTYDVLCPFSPLKSLSNWLSASWIA